MSMVSKNGRWVHRDADVHRCPWPTFDESPGVKTGDIWECNTCKAQWKVTVENHFDPRPSESYTTLKWDRLAPRIGTTSWRD